MRRRDGGHGTTRSRVAWTGLAGAWLLCAAVRAESPLALSCLGCHQPRVNAPTMPALGRFSAAQIGAALRAARDQPVPGSIMARFAAGLTDTDIEQLARELARPAPAP